jgi:hypothetical protein
VKISALKKMVREAVRAEMKAMEHRLEKKFAAQLNEALGSQPRQPLNAVGPEAGNKPKSGLSEIRARFNATQRGAEGGPGYEGMLNAPTGPPPTNTVATTKTGERYASGDGILEWFNKSKDEQAINEHAKTVEQMAKTDEYVQGIIGRNRIKND